MTPDELKQWLSSLTAPEDDETPCYYFSASDPYLKHEPLDPNRVMRDISFDDDGNIHIKNTSAYWIPELTLTEEISGTIYTVTGSYEGEDSFIRKLERITSRKFTNQLGGHGGRRKDHAVFLVRQIIFSDNAVFQPVVER